MGTTLPALNRRFAAERLDVELVRGEGYFYFVYDDGDPHHHDEQSIPVYRLNELPAAQWLDEGREFSVRRKAELLAMAIQDGLGPHGLPPQAEA
jgi:hypothetical protein